jgi:transposase
MTSLVDRLLPSQLWARIQPLLPPPPPRPRGGVPRHVPDRNCVAALLFMARTSTPWNLLPAKELGCGSATTCWRRLDEWARAGVFEQLQAVLLDELGEAGRLDLERVLVDSAGVRAVKGGADRRKSGRPRQAGDQAAPGRRRWRPAPCRGAHRRQRPRLDHAWGRGGRHPADPHAHSPATPPAGHRPRRQGLRLPTLPRGAATPWDHPRIARRRVESSQRLGRHRWRIERTIAWLLGWRRLRVRYERSDARFFTFAMLACSAILFNTLQQPPW